MLLLKRMTEPGEALFLGCKNFSFVTTFISAPGSVPVLSVFPSVLAVTEGEEALFECTARGEPPPTIRWSRENGRFPQFSSTVNGALRIFPTRIEDQGAYVCTAANTFGAKATLVTLIVKQGKFLVSKR